MELKDELYEIWGGIEESKEFIEYTINQTIKLFEYYNDKEI